jgi:acetyltransferase
VVEAACRRAGICRVSSFADFINAAKAFSLPPLEGDNLMVISRSGGHAVVTADAVAAHGFRLPPLAGAAAEKLAERLRAAVIKLQNPLDLGDLFDLDFYAEILEMVLSREDIDGVVFNHVFQSGPERAVTRKLVEKITALMARYHKPVALSLFADLEAVAAVREGLDLPVFSEPAAAVAALARLRARREFLASAAVSSRPLPEIAVPPASVRALLEEWLAVGARRADRTLFTDQALTVFKEYGLPTAPFALARDPQELLELGAEIGFPLVLKVVAEGLSHKSDVGGVLRGIIDRGRFTAAAPLLFERFAQTTGFCGVLVQREIAGDIEMIIGARRDPSFGAVFMLGMGGIYAEILQDVQLEPGPLDGNRVAAMLARLRGRQILAGARSRAGIDTGQLYRVFGVLQALLEEFPALSEIEINPLIFGPDGTGQVVDARIVCG